MTNAEMIVAIRVTAENVEETIESIKKPAEEMGATVEKVGRDAGNAFEPMKNSAAEAAAAQAALAAAAATAFKGVVSAVQSGTDAYNTYTSAIKGLDSIAAGRGIEVPLHLQSPLFRGYKYPHDYGGYVEQQYLPDSLKGKKYYIPKDGGYEKTIKEIRKRKGKA
mgnify:CR=1 FL=1